MNETNKETKMTKYTVTVAITEAPTSFIDLDSTTKESAIEEAVALVTSKFNPRTEAKVYVIAHNRADKDIVAEYKFDCNTDELVKRATL
jgi:hypothetical protein